MTRQALLAAGLSLLALAVAGCTSAPVATPVTTAFVSGSRTGSATGWVPELNRMFEAGVAAGDTWTFVSPDGVPEITGTLALTSTGANALAADAERAALRDRATALLDRPVHTAEADPLAAVVLAARTLDGTPGPHRIVVADSLLQTVAPLRFPDSGGALLGADPVQVADAMAHDGTLPRLPGVDVVLIGAGDVAPPQARLAEPARASLIALWTTVLERAGATVRVVESPRTVAPPAGLPPVAAVRVPRPPAVVPVVPTTVSLPDQVLGFLPDRAEFRDPATAADVVRPFAEALATGRFRIEVTGTTSSAGTEQGRRSLSRDRASLVADLVLRMSAVARDLVTVRAVGTGFPGFRPDRDAAGRLDPVAAAANRQVIISLVPR